MRAKASRSMQHAPAPDSGGSGFAFARRRATTANSNSALRGSHQVDNAVVAVRSSRRSTSAAFPCRRPRSPKASRRCSWPGRLDLRRLPDGREVLLDAAHNPDGAAALAAFLRTMPGGNPPLVFGAMRDKDVDGMLRVLAAAVGALVVTRASNPRSADPTAPGASWRRRSRRGVPVEVEPSPPRALAAAWRARSADCRRRIDFLARRRA